MTPKTYFSIFGVLSGLFGIGFVLAPAQVLIMYGIESTPAVGAGVAIVRRDAAGGGHHTLVRQGFS